MSSVKNILKDAGQKYVNDTRKALRDNDINASGDLSRSVESKVTEKGTITTLEVFANDYVFEAVQIGTSPQKARIDPFKLRINIDKWIKDKPIQTDDPGQANFLITRSIIKKGTLKWQEFGSKNKTSGILEKVFSDKSIDKLEEEITNTIFEATIEGIAIFSNLE